MKTSFNWLKEFINIPFSVEDTAKLLTDAGLEVEGIHHFESLKGGLKGLVVGEIISISPHPNADKLRLTKVNIGNEEMLPIVCGAKNIEVGQRVVIATVGTTIYPIAKEPLKISEAKIRGEISKGMICAEDEIGLSESHDGVMVLNPDAVVGMSLAQYLSDHIYIDDILEIGLTPNRADAMSHVGVARDLVAKIQGGSDAVPVDWKPVLNLPSIKNFPDQIKNEIIEINVEDSKACIRYSGLSIVGVSVKPSPAWMINRLISIGLRPINNIVDCTNLVMHELGQPLHAFDLKSIKGDKISVKKCHSGTIFTTLDNVIRELNSDDLMICNAEEPMCIAGVFGGINSGVDDTTTDIFLESACFDPVHVRRTSKRHGLKTDASFRFERGTDPNITVYALKRTALLILEMAGGTINSSIVDIYPAHVPNKIVNLSWDYLERISGVKIEKYIVKEILTLLGIMVQNENETEIELSVPPFKVDVTRASDAVEEILRIYGYNKIPVKNKINSSIIFSEKKSPENIRMNVANYLVANGFLEMMNTSLTSASFLKSEWGMEPAYAVNILNPLSNELNVLRQKMVASGLQVIAFNNNRQQHNLKLFEFGKSYAKSEEQLIETSHLSVFIHGDVNDDNWITPAKAFTFYSLKGYIEGIFALVGVKAELLTNQDRSNSEFAESIIYNNMSETIGKVGKLKKNICALNGIESDVYYADLLWDEILRVSGETRVKYNVIPRFPEVRRDLAMLIPKNVSFEQIRKVAYQTEKMILHEVNLFDVYEGEKIGKDKISYAISFILRHNDHTLTDIEIENSMEKLVSAFSQSLGAEIRR